MNTISEEFITEYCYEDTDIEEGDIKIESFDPRTFVSVVLGELISLMFSFLQILGIMGVRFLDKERTDKMREILKDDKVRVFWIKASQPNAFNIGTRSLYYTTYLRKMLTDKELESVLCHEYGHFVGKHMEKAVATDVSVGLLSGFIFSFIDLPAMIKTKLVIILTMITKAFASIGYNITFGRRHEYFSDSYAAKMGYKEELISSLHKIDKWVREKICKDLTKEECDDLLKNMNKWDEHPELKDRIDNILKSIVKDFLVKRLRIAKTKLKSLVSND